MKTTVGTPAVAVFCYALAWLGLVAGALLIIGGISDSSNSHIAASSSVGELTAGFALFVSSIIWFGIAKALTLLAQIEFNTRKPPQTFKVRTPELQESGKA